MYRQNEFFIVYSKEFLRKIRWAKEIQFFLKKLIEKNLIFSAKMITLDKRIERKL